MRVLQRTLFIICLLAWITCVILYPPWVGRFYNPHHAKPGEYFRGGTFGLEGAMTTVMNAPIWKPPRPSAADVIPTNVRMPWQPITAHEHIEIDISKVTSRITFGYIALGLLAGWSSMMIASKKPDLFITLVTCSSFGLIVAWLVVFGIAMGSSGYGPDEGLGRIILASGFLLGCGLGVFWFLRRRRTQLEQPG